MKIESANGLNGRHEWICEHCDEKFVVVLHSGADKSWTVQRLRNDGLREIVTADEAQEIMQAFPKELAFSVT